MSKPDTWMPLYVRDYLTDTMHLSTEQHGAYLLLICDYWLHGPPLDDDDVLASICRASRYVWRRLRPTIERFFQVSDGVWRHKRIDLELDRCAQRRKAASDYWNAIPRHVRTALQAKRRASMRRAAPPWLTRSHLDEIAGVYELARRLSEETGVAHEVDHIVPLQGESVSGLHVPWNLQAIPASENRWKGNRH